MCFTCLNPLSEVFPQLLRQNQDFTGRLTLLFYLRGLEICCPPKQGHVQGQSVDFPKGIRHSQKVDQSVKSLLWKITHDLSTKTAGFFPWPTLRLPKGIPSYLRSRDMRRKRWRISDIVSTSGDLTGCGDDLDISAVKTQPVVFTKRYERSASLQLKISGDDVHTRNDQRNKQCSRQFMFIPNGKTHSVFI